MEGILDNIKQMLGIHEEDASFDRELVLHVNSVMLLLAQLGIESSNGYLVIDVNTRWSELIGERKDLELVKAYIYLRIRLLFDPPQNSFLVDNIKKQCEEFEWRLNVQSSE